MSDEKKFKSGFVNIIGNPNVGKSTLMNMLMKERLVIATHKAQTTRHRIKGILTGEDYQIVFSDTPGVLDPAYELQTKMMDAVNESLVDADVILYVVEIGEKRLKNEQVFERLQKTSTPIILLLNKIDTATPDRLNEAVEYWHELLPKAEILPISAKENVNVDLLINKIKAIIPEGPQYYPEDQLTDRSERFIVNEVIREKILLNYQKEIPYSVEVVTERFKEDLNLISIEAEIFVERDSQKGIIIGHKGESLSKVGKEAREELEKFFDKKVFLKLFVKVRKDWRSKENDLRRFGY
ncbi:GTPase Era [Empedobacter falsenii]|jgi:GTP-binding protein Era|uniref:GTPase Era n=1 Tax=Empedobacter falsenii TaxID=343874 RepID=A0A376G0N1_9FLAO|nr:MULTISPECIES: GTPase Era [Empedobacter]HAD80548.1 GTPase Era [Flavobacteriaceae bacterium]MBW1618170.1 GTPase Era [Empedobacter falsenii]MBY0066139.1 GTPase Era [Empedobacter falsenii]MDH0658607.1 GTPase Era [Empedobacter sp. GD03865]MDH0675732.1 GTPase Era [Empedobacter sp. GD03861]